MNTKAARRLVKNLLFTTPAYQTVRVAGSEVAGIAYAVSASVRGGYEGIPEDMVYGIAEANAHRFIRQWLYI